jgi:hypothetical protein
MTKNFLDIVKDYEVSIDKKLQLFSEFDDLDARDMLNRIYSMYIFSGLNVYLNFIRAIVNYDKVDPILNFESAKNLISYSMELEQIEPWDSKDEIQSKLENNTNTIERNKQSREDGIEKLKSACRNLNKTPPNYRYDIIANILAEIDTELASKYMIDFISDHSIQEKTRYSCILSSFTNEYLKTNILDFSLTFFNNTMNAYMYRLVCAQFILVNRFLSSSINLEEQVLQIAMDKDVEYNTRADAADIILTLTLDEKNRQRARDIINELGRGEKRSSTIFDNAQNVHSLSIEKSVEKIVNFLGSIPPDVTFETVKREILYRRTNDKILMSLDRIIVDKMLYTSTKDKTLVDIITCLWSYILESEDLIERLLDELQDMASTCSSGFVSRLANVLSGRGDDELTLTITFEEQIIANFTARVNYRIKTIMHNRESPLWTTKYPEILRIQERKLNDENYNQCISRDDKKWKKIDITDKEAVMSEFASDILVEMSNLSYEYDKKPAFLLLLQTFIKEIHDELYAEFKEYVSDEIFSDAFHKAIVTYECNI